MFCCHYFIAKVINYIAGTQFHSVTLLQYTTCFFYNEALLKMQLMVYTMVSSNYYINETKSPSCYKIMRLNK